MPNEIIVKWKGRNIDEMAVDELRAAFREMIRIYRTDMDNFRRFSISGFEWEQSIDAIGSDQPKATVQVIKP
jgi:hypothetical protein